jgi:hypothetical protein
MTEADVTLIVNGTNGNEHQAIRYMLVALKVLNLCNAPNLKKLVSGYAQFANRTINVILYPAGADAPRAFQVGTDSWYCVHRVAGVGDFVTLYTR